MRERSPEGASMKHLVVDAYVRYAVVGTCLMVGFACRPPSADWEDPRGADSAKRVLAQHNRSSAGQTVEFEESERRKYARVENMIQARFSGVEVTQNGSGFTIKIRGTGSFTSSNEPLLVVDGSIRQNGTLNRISPLDVERIEIVKDGTASFYGARGANGVIIITTRRSR
jgi:TonB-dependent SusC/RagA subfamily outer membrane receptor